MLAFLKKFGFAVLLAFVLLFGYQNLEALSKTAKFHFDFYFFEPPPETPELPIVFLFVGFFLLGMIAAGFQGFYEKVARRIEIRKRDRRIRDLEKEVAELRSQPGASSPTSLPSAAGTAAPPPAPLEENPTL